MFTLYSFNKINFKLPSLIWMVLVVLLLFLPLFSNAQKDSTETTESIKSSTSISSLDSTFQDSDTTSVISDKASAWGIKVAKDALPAVVKTTAKDSAVLNVRTSFYYLYGDAQAEYEDMKVISAVMEFNQKVNEVTAIPIFDTLGNKISTQEFYQASEKFIYDTLRYNFASKKAIVKNARAQHGDGFVWSKKTKRHADGIVDGGDNIYTTCNLDHPHFGIKAKKIRIIPDKMIASGPARLEIQNIPTPLILPFGIFPSNQKGQTSGFILPTYTMEQRKGLGLQRGGYYFAINDYIGLSAQMDIFSKGSWGTFNTVQYANRYKYSGSFSVDYVYSKLGETYEIDAQISKDFKVRWSHQMDAKARPGTSFSASVDIGTSSYNRINGMSGNMILNNNYISSIAYSKSWLGKPYSFSASISHNQNTQTGLVNVTLPNINFSAGQFSPFQRKNMIGNPKWYEKISISYMTNAQNKWTFYDSTFNINQIDFSDFNYGIVHDINISAAYNIFKYINWSFALPIKEYWNFQKTMYQPDVITGETDTIRDKGFFATRDFNISTDLSTRIYGVKLYPKGRLAGIRHVITPSIGLGYVPSMAHHPFEYMYPEENYFGDVVYRSYYSQSPIGGPTNYTNQGNINFRLGNTLAIKVRSKDSTAETKNISIIDGLDISTSYNMFADSNNLSDIRMAFRTSFLGKLNLSGSILLDPYKYENARRTAIYLFEDGKAWVDFKTASLTIGTSFQGGSGNGKNEGDKNENINNIDLGDEEKSDQLNRLFRNNGVQDYHDFNIPWNLNINAGLNINKRRIANRSDTIVITPNLSFSGGFNLTERWKVNVMSGVDFQNLKEIKVGLTDISIVRDLHCWQMSLNLMPFGRYRSFFFTLNVKSAVLQDLKLTRKRSYQDNY